VAQIIILEGPDGAGKSTLALRLKQLVTANDGRAVIRHTTKPFPGEDVFKTYLNNILGALIDVRNGTTVIFDRFHLGELVYGSIIRGKSAFDMHGLHILDRIVNSSNATVTICLPSKDTCLRNWAARKGQEYVQEGDKLSQIWEAYANFAASNNDYLTYNYEVDPVELPDNFVPLPIGVIGSRTPKFLVVGEVANSTTIDLPFVSISGSSQYLNHLLFDAGFQESELAFVNARSIYGNGKFNLREIYEELGYVYPILLGRVAQAQWDEVIGSPRPLALPHPAYMKRFLSSERAAMVKRLQEYRKLVIQ
jgi:thymidylate kinase